MQFKIGDVVKLKSGGPKMTVTTIDSDEQIWCTWFVPGAAHEGQKSHFFPAASLESVSSKDGSQLQTHYDAGRSARRW